MSRKYVSIVFVAVGVFLLVALMSIYIFTTNSYFAENRAFINLRRILLYRVCSSMCPELVADFFESKSKIISVGYGEIGGKYLYAYTFTGSMEKLDLENRRLYMKDADNTTYVLKLFPRELDAPEFFGLDYYETTSDGQLVKRTLVYSNNEFDSRIYIRLGDVIRIDWNDPRDIDAITGNREGNIVLNDLADQNTYMRIVRYVK